MGKVHTFIDRTEPLFRSWHRFRKACLSIFPIILLVSAVLFFVMNTGLSEIVWLPDPSKYKSDNEILFSLPVKGETVITQYGRATRFTTISGWSTVVKNVPPWITIDEFHSNRLLKPSECPNIGNLETLLPSGCNKIGEFKGSAVYGINRSLPSGGTEYFTVVNGVFIYIRHGGDGGQSLDYLNTFKAMPRSEAAKQLAANDKRATQTLARQQTLRPD